MKNDDFSADYYRMTGNKFTFLGGIKTHFFLITLGLCIGGVKEICLPKIQLQKLCVTG